MYTRANPNFFDGTPVGTYLARPSVNPAGASS
jgi:hypothetical protein